jgi:hypothetical protein
MTRDEVQRSIRTFYEAGDLYVERISCRMKTA